MQVNSHFPVEEASHQLVSVTVHGNVLIQPRAFNFSLTFSNALVDEIVQNLVTCRCSNLSLVASSRPDSGLPSTLPSPPLVTSHTPDSGFGISPQILTTHGLLQYPPPNEHHAQGSLVTILSNQRRRHSDQSREHNWSHAEINTDTNMGCSTTAVIVSPVCISLVLVVSHYPIFIMALYCAMQSLGTGLVESIQDDLSSQLQPWDEVISTTCTTGGCTNPLSHFVYSRGLLLILINRVCNCLSA